MDEQKFDGAHISRVVVDRFNIFVVLRDGTARKFEVIDHGYDCGSSLEESDVSMGDRHELGLITDEELQAYYDAENEKLKSKREMAERADYQNAQALVEQLKHKYG